MNVPPQVFEGVEQFGNKAGPYIVHGVISASCFLAGVAAAQAACLSLRLHSSIPYVSPTAGFVAVAAASCIVGRAAAALSPPKPQGKAQRWHDVDPIDVAIDVAIGVAAYKMLGGQFRSLLPSNLVKPGAFMRGNISSYPEARGSAYAGDSTKKLLVVLYERDGCHHCGTKSRVRGIVGDHMPPNKVVDATMAAAAPRFRFKLPDALSTLFKPSHPVTTALAKASPNPPAPSAPRPIQYFLPQCSICSSRQGGALSADRAAPLLMHFWCMRLPTLMTGPIVGMRYFTGAPPALPGLSPQPHVDRNRRNRR